MDSKEHATWIQALSDWLLEQPDVEAILVNPESQKVSIATLGQIKDEDRLRVHFQSIVEEIEHEIFSYKEDLGKDSGRKHSSNVQIRNLENQTLIERKSCPTAPKFWRWRDIPWPESSEDEHDEPDWKIQLGLSALCGAFALAGYLTSSESGVSWLSLILYIVSMFIGGWHALEDAWLSLKKGELDIHFLMLAVAVGASLIGEFGEGAMLLFLFSTAGALEHFALERSKSEISSLFDKTPKTAIVIGEDGQESSQEVSRISVGTKIRVRAGDGFPLDGLVLEGETSANEAALTGESVPVAKNVGDPVYAGSINEGGSVLVKVTRRSTESAIQRIMRMIRESQKMKTKVESLADRYGNRYTLFVLLVTFLSFSFWYWVIGLPAFQSSETVSSAFYRAMTLMVVLSPCALVLSVPSALLASIAWGAKRGILFRGGIALEKMNYIGIVALDKTGTLTTGEMEVIRVESFPSGKEELIGEFAYNMEARTSHPIAQAIVNYGKNQNYKQIEVTDFQSSSGFGLKATIDGKTSILGRREMLEGVGKQDWLDSVETPDDGCIEVWFVREDLVGRLILKDKIRNESQSFVSSLQSMGKKVVMLTGDRRKNAEDVGSKVGIQDVYAELLPQDKVEKVREFTKDRPVMMVGDGVNDGPSLAAAHVSVAMGAKGSDVALETSEVVLMNDGLEGILQALHLAKRSRRIIIQNLVISLGTVFVMSAFVFLDWVQLSEGVFAHEGSTVIVCLNSLRLLFIKE